MLSRVYCNGKITEGERDGHISKMNFEQAPAVNEQMDIHFEYKGDIDQSFCYLDIEDYELNDNGPVRNTPFYLQKQYSFITPRFVLLTPETYWYPRPGTSYSPKYPEWQQTYFSEYRLEVLTSDSLRAVSQGECVNDSNKYVFTPEYKLQNISLTIGNYIDFNTNVDGVDY